MSAQFHDGLDPQDQGKKAKGAHVWERDERDWYVEPARCTRQLLAHERFQGVVWDPACGQGNIVETLLVTGHQALGTDIVRRVPKEATWFHGERDFLAMERPVALNIVMNPPFFRAKGTESFIRKALSFPVFKVAAFCDIRFLAGGKRAEGLYTDHPPSRVYVVTPRASCPPGRFLQDGGKAGNGSSDWVWLVWDRTAPFTGTQMCWLTAADEGPRQAPLAGPALAFLSQRAIGEAGAHA